MMNTHPRIAAYDGPAELAAFAAPVFDAQKTFRAVMAALAEPGTVQETAKSSGNRSGLSDAMVAIALTLFDFETQIWLDPKIPKATTDLLRFQTCTEVASDPGKAAFALISDPIAMPRFDRFAQGTLEHPDRATTLLIEVAEIQTGRGWFLSGPGIPTHRRLDVSALPEWFDTDVGANRDRFPCGIDIVFCSGHHIAALPRSTRVTRQRMA
jgi:alpha-D-ribose 1-methylphosphonate 5-triphosphate synthase subunit PhnH